MSEALTARYVIGGFSPPRVATPSGPAHTRMPPLASIGSSNDGSSFLTLFTRGLTG